MRSRNIIYKQRGWLLAATLLFLGCGPDGGDPVDEPDTSDVADTADDVDTTDIGADVELDVAPGPACLFTEDGVCDEPANCPLGTDEVDCDEACSRPEPAPELWGACHYRTNGIYDEATREPLPHTRASEGSGGPRGRWYGTMRSIGPEGNVRQTEERHYEVYVPYAYTPSYASPLVFYGGGFGDEMFPNSAYTELEALAEQNGFIMVNVQQAFRDFGPRGYRHSWYTYEGAWSGPWSRLPDIAFLSAVVDELAGLYNLDLNRVIMTGTSRGGAISILMAILAPDVFSGFISHAGFLEVSDFDDYIRDEYEGPKMPAFIVVGHQDTNVGTEESDVMEAVLRERGWTDDEVVHYEIDPAGHQWQTQLSQEAYDFVVARPMGTLGEAE